MSLRPTFNASHGGGEYKPARTLQGPRVYCKKRTVCICHEHQGYRLTIDRGESPTKQLGPITSCTFVWYPELQLTCRLLSVYIAILQARFGILKCESHREPQDVRTFKNSRSFSQGTDTITCKRTPSPST